jgi:hypothetical protein
MIPYHLVFSKASGYPCSHGVEERSIFLRSHPSTTQAEYRDASHGIHEALALRATGCVYYTVTELVPENDIMQQSNGVVLNRLVQLPAVVARH